MDGIGARKAADQRRSSVLDIAELLLEAVRRAAAGCLWSSGLRRLQKQATSV